MYIPHAIDEHNITVVVDNETHIIPRSALNYNAIKDALNSGDHSSISSLLDTKTALETQTEGKVSCNGESVTYNGEVIENSATQKLLNLIADGYSDITPWLKFIDKLMRNPSFSSREQAYKFLEHKGMPLTADGNVLGYKGVREDYKDKWSGKFSNHVGAELSMERTQVDDNINHGCSAGFHVGSHEYADSWASSDGKLMLVEFSPEDIVSVPHDCQYAKLRVCKYRVVSECFDRKILDDSGVYGNQTNENTAEIVQTVKTQANLGGAFKNLLHHYPNKTVNDFIDAFEAEGLEPPKFQYDSDLNDLRIFLDKEEPFEENYEYLYN